MNLQECADLLWKARLEKKPCASLTDLKRDLSIEEAYFISKLNFQKRIQLGEKAIGKKIGLTSLAVQKQLGVHEPDFGYLTSVMRVADVPRESLIQGKAEGEVAFVLKKDLSQSEITEEDVIAATDYVVPCIEVIDSRIENWKIKIQDTIADNASSAYLILGDQKTSLSKVDLRMAGMALYRNGEIESTGVGAACLDHPIKAMTWLANRMAKLGAPLLAGEVILSGAYGPVVPFLPGDQVEVKISGLGSVRGRYLK